MRRLLRLLGLAVLAIGFGLVSLQVFNSGDAPVPPHVEDGIRIATHNVHYIRLRRAEGPWSTGDWEQRKDALDAAFKEIDADIFAFQEMESFAGGNDGSVNLARDYLLTSNPLYAAAASGDWRQFPSTQPIFYRKDRFAFAGQGWFFFSDTPDVLYSRTFDGSYPAFASWARFEEIESGETFRVLNLHFEYSSRSNRRLSAALVRDRIAPWIAAGDTVILAGDLNALSRSATADILREAGLRFARISGATYHFDLGLNLFGAIDHIGATPDVTWPGEAGVLRRRFGGDWPSDHYPVYLDVVLPSE